ncbi:hypothetical protein [Pantoea dispersa]|uniref:hypothetical protein n=1 Tax=Pantoea dispersa TaxID=59814 RepID=UPI0021C60E28|nr:hypothetical protein [Pantoea dispersa]
MEGFKGTPGKWVVDGDYDVTTEDGTVISWTSLGVFEPDEMIANSKLIAAAPELLEALQWAMTKIGPYTQRTSSNQAHCDQIDKANAAIAKALGQ